MEEQLAASVTVTVYDPEARPEISSLVEALDQMKVQAPDGETERSITPFGIRHRVLGMIESVTVKFEFCMLIVKESTVVHPLAPVTVTMYTPAESPEISSVMKPFDQEKEFPLTGSIERSIAPF